LGRKEKNLLSNEVLALAMLESLNDLRAARQQRLRMFWQPKDKGQQRFYLLPGMGGKAFRRKQKTILYWSIAAGLAVSALVACILYVISRQPIK
jgi:hypothetical protein